LRRFMLTQVLLAALVDGRLEAAELAFVERLARAVGVDAAALARLEAEVSDFYREHEDALAALRLAEAPEGLPHALTTRLEAAVLDNLDRLLQEIRETRELADVLRLQSLRTLHHVELHLLALRKCAEAVGLDGRVVTEHVLTTAVLRDEAEPLRIVEPLHSSSCHLRRLPSVNGRRKLPG